MKLIMENWRQYLNTIESEYNLETNPSIFLFENNSRTPTKEIGIDYLIEKYQAGKINESILIDTWHKSYDYEYDLLVQEGVADVMLKPIDAFANTNIAIAAKRKTKIGLSSLAAKTFATVMKMLKAMFAKAQTMEKLIIRHGTGKPADQKKIVSIHQKSIKFIGAAAKKLIGVAGKIIKSIFKFFSHPLIKTCIIVVCLGILILSFFKASIFVGALALAPAYAARRLGVKGAVAFWKRIPSTKKEVSEAVIAASLATKLTLTEADVKLLNEVELELNDFLGQAIAEIAQDIEEGATSVTWSQYGSESFVTNAGEEVAMNSEFNWTALDRDLDAKLEAINELQMQMNDPGSFGSVEQYAELTTYSGELATLSDEIIRSALRAAEVTCANDPDMCRASNILAQEFEQFNTTWIKSENVYRSYASTVNGEVAEEWQRIAQTRQTIGTDTVVSNPFEKPELTIDNPDAPDAVRVDRSQARAMGDQSKLMGTDAMKSAVDQDFDALQSPDDEDLLDPEAQRKLAISRQRYRR